MWIMVIRASLNKGMVVTILIMLVTSKNMFMSILWSLFFYKGSMYRLYLVHRYRPEIPEPAPSLIYSGMRLQLGVCGFSHKQNNHVSLDVLCTGSEPENKNTWNAAQQAKIVDTLFVSAYVVGKNLNTPIWAPWLMMPCMGWYKSSGISSLYLWAGHICMPT